MELTAENLEALPVGAVVRVASRQNYRKVRQGEPNVKHYELTIWLKQGSSHGWKTTAELLEIAGRNGQSN
jgi:hypothetical protein